MKRNIYSHVLKVSVVLFLMTTVFYSCEKEKSFFPETAKSIQNVVPNSELAYFAELGAYHNEILAYVGSHGDMTHFDREKRFYLAQEYTKSEHDWDEERTSGDIMMKAIDDRVVFSSFIEDPYLKESVGGYLDDLSNLFFHLIDQAEKELVIEPADFNIKVDEIVEKVYRNEVVKVDTRTGMGNEYAFVVAACFLAKSTYEYWFTAAIDELSPWHLFLFDESIDKKPGPIGRFFRRLWKGVKIAVYDTGGFIIGGTTGTLSGFENPDDDIKIGVSINLHNGIKLAGKWSGSVE
ncbi:MAG: hypothetical protein ACOXZK_09900 [Bacteroidales bacterium]